METKNLSMKRCMDEEQKSSKKLNLMPENQNEDQDRDQNQTSGLSTVIDEEFGVASASGEPSTVSGGEFGCSGESASSGLPAASGEDFESSRTSVSSGQFVVSSGKEFETRDRESFTPIKSSTSSDREFEFGGTSVSGNPSAVSGEQYDFEASGISVSHEQSARSGRQFESRGALTSGWLYASSSGELDYSSRTPIFGRPSQLSGRQFKSRRTSIFDKPYSVSSDTQFELGGDFRSDWSRATLSASSGKSASRRPSALFGDYEANKASESEWLSMRSRGELEFGESSTSCRPSALFGDNESDLFGDYESNKRSVSEWLSMRSRSQLESNEGSSSPGPPPLSGEFEHTRAYASDLFPATSGGEFESSGEPGPVALLEEFEYNRTFSPNWLSTQFASEFGFSGTAVPIDEPPAVVSSGAEFVSSGGSSTHDDTNGVLQQNSLIEANRAAVNDATTVAASTSDESQQQAPTSTSGTGKPTTSDKQTQYSAFDPSAVGLGEASVPQICKFNDRVTKATQTSQKRLCFEHVLSTSDQEFFYFLSDVMRAGYRNVLDPELTKKFYSLVVDTMCIFDDPVESDEIEVLSPCDKSYSIPIIVYKQKTQSVAGSRWKSALERKKPITGADGRKKVTWSREQEVVDVITRDFIYFPPKVSNVMPAKGILKKPKRSVVADTDDD